MNRDGFLVFVKNNRFILVAGAITVAVLLLAANTLSSDKNSVSESAEIESRLCSFLESMNGVGKCKAFVSFSSDGEICGVSVLCSGGENINTKSSVEDFLHRVLCVPIANISVDLLIE